MKIELASPRGFCAGVERAIAIVERALEEFGPPVHVRHEVVHNRPVVEGLRAKGAVFVEELDAVPDGAIVIFSAHGVSKAVRSEAESRGLRIFDATCPLVTKVHVEVERHRAAGRECVLVGHAGHPEVEGTLGQANDGEMYLVESVEDVAALEVPDPGRLGFVTQTTLSIDDTAVIVDALRARFPAIRGPKKDDICYATQSRQDAVKRLAPGCDAFIVAGSRNSSNSNRLRDIAEQRGVPRPSRRSGRRPRSGLVRGSRADRGDCRCVGVGGIGTGDRRHPGAVGRRDGGGERSAPRGDRVLTSTGASSSLIRMASPPSAHGPMVPNAAARAGPSIMAVVGPV